MDPEVKQLKQSRIPIVKVRWNSRRGLEFTWEQEDFFKNKYPHLFLNKKKASMRNRAPGRRCRKEGRIKMYHTFIALIPKVSTPHRINDYRPISCCNAIYKCISKILTNCIIEGIKEIVDIQKAYGTVDWNFLETILKRFGFHTGKRGLRQGDPLSPYLFTLVMEVLTLILRRQVRNSDFLGDINSGKIIMDSLNEFKNVSGLVPSILRSHDLLLYNVVNLDCKVLVEKAQNKIGDWKNKSLSYAGRLQLCKSLIRGFLWCNGELKRGKAKVAWADICLPKSEGGLGLRSLEIFNIALMTTHIWNIISNKESLWVRWIHMYKLKGRSLWEVPLKRDASWGWLKLLQLRDHVRPFFWKQIGSGRDVSIWFDWWSDECPLIRYLSPRDILREGFKLQDTIADMVSNEGWRWPQTWLLKAPILGYITTHVLEEQKTATKTNCKVTSRNKSCSNNIPRHAFHLWLVMRKSLKTHDKLRQWDVGGDLNLIWLYIRNLAGMDIVPARLEDIMDFLQPTASHHTTEGTIGRLLLAASSYFIWSERNNRTFKQIKRSPEDIRDIIMVTVRLKLITIKFKNTLKVNQLLSTWKMPLNARIYED
ncbi:hypothetical protein Tco_1150746 [Tanacetum coccineum]